MNKYKRMRYTTSLFLEKKSLCFYVITASKRKCLEKEKNKIETENRKKKGVPIMLNVVECWAQL